MNTTILNIDESTLTLELENGQSCKAQLQPDTLRLGELKVGSKVFAEMDDSQMITYIAALVEGKGQMSEDDLSEISRTIISEFPDHSISVPNFRKSFFERVGAPFEQCSAINRHPSEFISTTISGNPDSAAQPAVEQEGTSPATQQQSNRDLIARILEAHGDSPMHLSLLGTKILEQGGKKIDQLLYFLRSLPDDFRVVNVGGYPHVIKAASTWKKQERKQPAATTTTEKGNNANLATVIYDFDPIAMLNSILTYHESNFPDRPPLLLSHLGASFTKRSRGIPFFDCFQPPMTMRQYFEKFPEKYEILCEVQGKEQVRSRKNPKPEISTPSSQPQPQPKIDPIKTIDEILKDQSASGPILVTTLNSIFAGVSGGVNFKDFFEPPLRLLHHLKTFPKKYALSNPNNELEWWVQMRKEEGEGERGSPAAPGSAGQPRPQQPASAPVRASAAAAAIDPSKIIDDILTADHSHTSPILITTLGVEFSRKSGGQSFSSCFDRPIKMHEFLKSQPEKYLLTPFGPSNFQVQLLRRKQKAENGATAPTPSTSAPAPSAPAVDPRHVTPFNPIKIVDQILSDHKKSKHQQPAMLASNMGMEFSKRTRGQRFPDCFDPPLSMLSYLESRPDKYKLTEEKFGSLRVELVVEVENQGSAQPPTASAPAPAAVAPPTVTTTTTNVSAPQPTFTPPQPQPQAQAQPSNIPLDPVVVNIIENIIFSHMSAGLGPLSITDLLFKFIDTTGLRNSLLSYFQTEQSKFSAIRPSPFSDWLIAPKFVAIPPPPPPPQVQVQATSTQIPQPPPPSGGGLLPTPPPPPATAARQTAPHPPPAYYPFQAPTAPPQNSAPLHPTPPAPASAPRAAQQQPRPQTATSAPASTVHHLVTPLRKPLEVLMITRPGNVEEALTRLKASLPSASKIVGMCVEYNDRTPQLIELSTDSLCVLLHMRAPGIPTHPSLTALLSDPTILKCGCDLPAMVGPLVTSAEMGAGQQCRGIVNLSPFSTGNRQSRGLKPMFEQLHADAVLERRRDVAMSDWSRLPLASDQISFAAMGAWASFAVAVAVNEDEPLSSYTRA